MPRFGSVTALFAWIALLANQSANWAEWDEELLRLEFEELKQAEFDLDLTGFDAEENRPLLGPAQIESCR